MNCTEIRELLSLYIDDELDESQAAEIGEHLKNCEECRREYDEFIEITELLREAPTIPLPGSFDEKLKEAIRKEKLVKIYTAKRRWKMLSSIAAVFVIGIFSITMYNQIAMDPSPDNTFDLLSASDTFIDDIVTIPPDEDQDFGNVFAEEETVEAPVIEETHNDNPVQITPFYAEAAPNPGLRSLPEEVEPSGLVSRRNQLSDEAKTEVDYYVILLEERLKGLHYQVMDYFRGEDGIWRIYVEIYTVDEYMANYIESYTYLAQDGVLWIEDLSSSTGTAF